MKTKGRLFPESIVIMGEPGSGKTRTALFLAGAFRAYLQRKMNRAVKTLILDAEGGFEAINLPKFLGTPGKDFIHLSLSEIKDVYEFKNTAIETIHNVADENRKSGAALIGIVDSVSILQSRMVSRIHTFLAEQYQRRGKTYVSKNLSPLATELKALSISQRETYRYTHRMMVQIFDALHSSNPESVVYVTHPKDTVVSRIDRKTGKEQTLVLRTPDVQPAVQAYLARVASQIAYVTGPSKENDYPFLCFQSFIGQTEIESGEKVPLVVATKDRYGMHTDKVLSVRDYVRSFIERQNVGGVET